ncbi:type III polyketide synthase [Opitutales bacterium ASA1]|uniref:type III polyketide synthase n=1 Tax=Congregicoccus parvus TaxID=3081749 RepID=UPI002B2D6890|nr:type III polyketide synthase [Opitutales bacterium ASA1]
MLLDALATATPEFALTQTECWERAAHSQARNRLSVGAQLLLRRVLTGESGITKRHFAEHDFESLLEGSADELNARFREAAPRVASAALAKALDRSGMDAGALDALFVCTCTGYLCPGVSSYVAERLALRSDAYLQDLVGLGCGAAIPTLRSAQGFLAANPHARVACVAVEICSAAFYVDDDPGVLISACLFGDGAAATIWSSGAGRGRWRLHGFDTLHIPEDRDHLRFEMRHGKLRNLLHRSVPARAARAVETLWSRRGTRPVESVAVHPGGRDVLAALEPVLAPYDLGPSARVLRAYGNMSSPSVLFVLEEILRERPEGRAGDVWLCSFGAGFAVHSCRLSPRGAD